MRIDAKKYRGAIEGLYTDTATIYRYEYVRNPDTGVDEKKPVEKYDDQPCRVSQRALATMNQTEAQNNILYETKLFISPELPLLQGDLVIATRNGIERKYELGEPFLYPTHQEASMQRREWS